MKLMLIGNIYGKLTIVPFHDVKKIIKYLTEEKLRELRDEYNLRVVNDHLVLDLIGMNNNKIVVNLEEIKSHSFIYNERVVAR